MNLLEKLAYINEEKIAFKMPSKDRIIKGVEKKAGFGAKVGLGTLGVLTALAAASKMHHGSVSNESEYDINDHMSNLKTRKDKMQAVRTAFTNRLNEIENENVDNSKTRVDVDRSMLPILNDTYSARVNLYNKEGKPIADKEHMFSNFSFDVSNNRLRKDTRGLIDAVFISPKMQGKGIGRDLALASMDAMEDVGAKSVRLTPMDAGTYAWSRPYFGLKISKKTKGAFLKAYKDYSKEKGIEFRDLGNDPSNYPSEFLKNLEDYLETFGVEYVKNLGGTEKKASIEKTALNASKARAMAKEVGLLPEGQWKWALRQLRGKKGKELSDAKKKLGSLPNNTFQKVVGASERMGHRKEIGISMNRGDQPLPKFRPGGDFNEKRKLMIEARKHGDRQTFEDLRNFSLEEDYSKFGNRLGIGKAHSVTLPQETDIKVHTHPMNKRVRDKFMLKLMKSQDKGKASQEHAKFLKENIEGYKSALRMPVSASGGDKLNLVERGKIESIVDPRKKLEGIHKARPKGIRSIILDRTPRKSQ